MEVEESTEFGIEHQAWLSGQDNAIGFLDDDLPDFHGFGKETKIPERIEIIVPDDEKEDIQVVQKKRLEVEESTEFGIEHQAWLPGQDNAIGSLDDVLPDFHGFGKETKIPERIEIIVPDDEEEDIQVVQKKRLGRPRYSSKKPPNLILSLTPRRPSSSSTPMSPPPDSTAMSPTACSVSSSAASLSPVSPSAVVGPPTFNFGGTSTRTVLYLLEQPPTSTMGAAKLPKTISVLRVFFHFLKDEPSNSKNPNPLTLATKDASLEAATKTVKKIKEVWLHQSIILD